MPADGPPLLPDEPIAFADDGYDPALSTDERDQLQVAYERALTAAQADAHKLQRVIDVHAAVTAAYGDGSVEAARSQTHVAGCLSAVNAAVCHLDGLKASLLAAAKPQVTAGEGCCMLASLHAWRGFTSSHTRRVLLLHLQTRSRAHPASTNASAPL